MKIDSFSSDFFLKSSRLKFAHCICDVCELIKFISSSLTQFIYICVCVCVAVIGGGCCSEALRHLARGCPPHSVPGYNTVT